ncbi:SDR family oxidoreductase [Bizionia gelidisalsuginis]|uniref:SDR family oxidoreductase n=1 Tax=Bizionia gelidisalsuginis TaxID=291188 RepID=UPI001FE7B964|nr:SDR family oxidoreductase [Bizionia gelidisalsuginis]
MSHTEPTNANYYAALSNPKKVDSFNTISKFVNESSDIMYIFAKRGVQFLTQKHADKWGKKAAEEHPERMALIKKATPLKRNGQPEDIADVIRFLISDDARLITGTNILLDGGVINNIKKANQS